MVRAARPGRGNCCQIIPSSEGCRPAARTAAAGLQYIHVKLDKLCRANKATLRSSSFRLQFAQKAGAAGALRSRDAKRMGRPDGAVGPGAGKIAVAAAPPLPHPIVHLAPRRSIFQTAPPQNPEPPPDLQTLANPPPWPARARQDAQPALPRRRGRTPRACAVPAAVCVSGRIPCVSPRVCDVAAGGHQVPRHNGDLESCFTLKHIDEN